MTKSELAEAVSARTGLPPVATKTAVDQIFACIESSLQRGERVSVRGFGHFTVRDYKAYLGRNPRTGTPVDVAAKRYPSFKVGKDLYERINRARETPPSVG